MLYNTLGIFVIALSEEISSVSALFALSLLGNWRISEWHFPLGVGKQADPVHRWCNLSHLKSTLT